MNYLAHVYLSGDSADAQLGGLLGDFIKGPLPLAWLSSDMVEPLIEAQREALQGLNSQGSTHPLLLGRSGKPWARELLAGVYLHRAIDAYIDRHPIFKLCIERLGTEHRRVAGIALDVFFDHLLARHWQRFHRQNLSEFSEAFYSYCATRRDDLPTRAETLMIRAQQHKLFESYAQLDVIEAVLMRIDQRLSRRTSLNRIMPVLREEEAFLLQQFELLMPELQVFAAQQRRNLKL